jgi:hypothetical protein
MQSEAASSGSAEGAGTKIGCGAVRRGRRHLEGADHAHRLAIPDRAEAVLRENATPSRA